MNVGLLITLLVGGLGLGGTLGFVAGQSQAKQETIANMSVAPKDSDDIQVFMLDGKSYKRSELPSDIETRLYAIESDAFVQTEGLMKEFILRLSLDLEKNPEVKISELPELQELLETPEIPEEELKAFYEQNKERLPPGTDFEQIKDRLQQFLGNQKGAEFFQKKWQELADSGKAKILVAAPKAPLVSIPLEKFPSQGASEASYTLVEVSDYLCPHCQSIHPVVKETLKEMGEKVKFVQINFPLRPDQLSGMLAKGAYCAQKQSDEGFWKYHDIAFDGSWGSMGDEPDAEKPKAIAKKAGLDEAVFATCLEDEATQAYISEVREIVSNIGVTGTPSFFLNNRRLNLTSVEGFSDTLKQAMSAGS